MPKILATLISIVLGAIILIGFLFIVAQAKDGHAKYHHGFYSKLMIPGTQASCCNDKDCRPTPHRFDRKAGFQVKIGNAWVKPPVERTMIKVTPDGGAHICRSGHYIFCAIQPFQGY